MTIECGRGGDCELFTGGGARKPAFDVQVFAIHDAIHLTSRADGQFIHLNLAIQGTLHMNGASGRQLTFEVKAFTQNGRF